MMHLHLETSLCFIPPAGFSNCNAEDYINIDKDEQTKPDTMDIDALVQNFRESQKEREEEEEEEGQTAKTVNCVQKTLLDYWKK
jgi:hypothetical protein